MNEILIGITILVSFLIVLGVYKYQGLVGLYCLVPIFYIIANIQVLKQVDLFNFPLALGDVAICSVVLIGDLITENYNKIKAKKVIFIGFMTTVIITVMMTLTIKFEPNSQDFAHESIKTIFSFTPRILIASLISYIFSETIEINLYSWIKKRLPKTRDLWIRNNVSGLISAFIDSMLVSFLMFFATFPVTYILKIALARCAIKAIASIIDTPFVYLSKIIKPKEFKED